jgi:hypothetical protein
MTHGFEWNLLKGEPVNSTASTGFMERAMGIEPTFEAWEATPKPTTRVDAKMSPELTVTFVR